MQNSPTPPKLIRHSRIVVLILYYGLLVNLTVANLFMKSVHAEPNITVWLIQLVPLLLFIRGITRHHPRIHAWLSFVILFYFTQAVLLAFSPEARVAGLFQTALCSALFIALVTYIHSYRKFYKVSL